MPGSIPQNKMSIFAIHTEKRRSIQIRLCQNQTNQQIINYHQSNTHTGNLSRVGRCVFRSDFTFDLSKSDYRFAQWIEYLVLECI